MVCLPLCAGRTRSTLNCWAPCLSAVRTMRNNYSRMRQSPKVGPTTPSVHTYVLSNLILLLHSALRRGCYSVHSPLQGSARCHTTGLIQVAMSCMCVQLSQEYLCIFIYFVTDSLCVPLCMYIPTCPLPCTSVRVKRVFKTSVGRLL